MTWLSLLINLLKLATGLFNYIERNQLMSAGEARALAAQLEELNGRVKKALEARESVARDAAAGRLRDDDGYRQD
jgi:hypothetical protein